MVEIVSLVLNLVLSGGLIVTLATLKSIKKKAHIESEQEQFNLSKSYIDEFKANIVEPLKEEINEYKKELANLRREIKRLRKAFKRAEACKHFAVCPVRHELLKPTEDYDIREPPAT